MSDDYDGVRRVEGVRKVYVLGCTPLASYPTHPDYLGGCTVQ